MILIQRNLVKSALYSRLYCDVFPRSSVKIFSNGREEKKEKEQINHHRRNPVNIQMISESLHRQIFPELKKDHKSFDDLSLNKLRREFLQHGIDLDKLTEVDNVPLKLPMLKGANIEDHFYQIADEQSKPYKDLLQIITKSKPPPTPKTWRLSVGWTKYDPKTGIGHDIEYPDSDALVFDVEVCMKVGKAPTLAVALSPTHWYSWCSQRLLDINEEPIEEYSTEDFINIETTAKQKGFPKDSAQLKRPKIIIGHNVSYDRARIKEQYWLESTGARFLDTLSLHVCVSGLTSFQRAMMKSKEMPEEDLLWSSQSSLNNLGDVYRLYCNQELDKEARNVFVEGNMKDIYDNFQKLTDYCAKDVLATHSISTVLYPMFLDRFAHPATLAGMLEIGQAYLPVNSNWKRYITDSDLSYEELSIESKRLLSNRADKMCHLMHNNSYETDLWMWDEDWTSKEFKFKKATKKKLPKNPVDSEKKSKKSELEMLKDKFQHLYDMKSLLPARRPLLPGYPEWYRKLCIKPTDPDWQPGAVNISTSMQISPKLLRLCWEGFPLHFIRGQGWGFLMPHKNTRPPGSDGKIPFDQLVEKCPVQNVNSQATKEESLEALYDLSDDVQSNLSRKDYYSKVKKDKTGQNYMGSGVFCNENLEKCVWFMKLPHKDGGTNRVGNPLAKTFIAKFSENVLSGEGSAAQRVIEIAKVCSYWRNNCDRIKGQLVVWLKKFQLPSGLRAENVNDFGAILPQVISAGTVTRRAVESTWMTASNAQSDRIGSELRAMIQAPPGYRIVGADVDSQELWIAAVLGDAHAVGEHGATPFGWMTLSGSKETKTDMHSVTAQAVGISRDHAKVINYARIYGAGQNFAERLLKQFNPTISNGEARSKAIKMFNITKGKKVYRVRPEYYDQFPDREYTMWEAMKMTKTVRVPMVELFYKPHWEGGSESAMFNRLEEIAGNEEPKTPFLGGRLSRALEPQGNSDDRFLPTRINWVVQSGAVDYLHLMLVCMRWLMGDRVRFSLSFHDEVRYLVKEEDAYKTALALHVTNLLTRSFCSSRYYTLIL